MRILEVYFKKNGKRKYYGSLEAFLDRNTDYTNLKNKINYRISRLKKIYEDETVKIERHTVIRGKSKKKNS